MMKFIRDKGAAGRLPEKKNRKGTLRGILGLALLVMFSAALAAGGIGTRTYAWNLDPPGIEEDGELVTFPSTSGKENGTETEKGNDWTSGLEGGTTIAILSDGEPSTISAENERSDMQELLTGVTIKDKDGKEIPKEGGTLYVGEDYKIHLEFTEGGAQGLQFDAGAEVLYYQIPANFKVTPQGPTDLTVKIGGIPVKIGTYSIDENGMLTVYLDPEEKKKLSTSPDVSMTFDMDATAQSAKGDSDGKVHFGGVGEEFDFKIVDQPRVEVEKEGKYTENTAEEGKMASGGKLEYTVKTKVKHGEVHDLSILDELTPPNTSALEVGEVKSDDIKVTLKQRGAGENDTGVELKKGEDYELVEVEDKDHPGKKTFHIRLKEDSQYYTLNEGDELDVTYNYSVQYIPGSTDVFWGNVVNDVNVKGKGTVPLENPEESEKAPEIDIDVHRGSNVEIQVIPPGDGIIFKTQEFSEADHKLHYTLYTKVPAGEWTPFYIQDDMVVEFGGEKYNLQEFKEGGRVSNLKVSAVDVNDDALGNWSDSTDEHRRQSLEELKKSAHPLTGYDIFNKWSESPVGYDPTSVENCIRLWDNNNLDIIFGEWEYGKQSLYGNWSYGEDRLIITEYDLDMSDALGELTLVNMSDYTTSLKKSASEVLLAGIRNTVHMRFDGYYPGYSVFFNNAERMNKTGVPDKNDNTITWTVTMNTTDTTVNKYFQDVRDDWMAQNADDKYHWANMPAAYKDSMQAVFYDELPDGWEYVEGSLTATASNIWGNKASYPYDENGQLKGSHDLVTKDGDKQVISAPLMFFYDNANTWRNNLFNWFGSELESLTFTYKLKATDQWIRAHVTDKNAVPVHNHAEIRDNVKDQPHWTADANVDYLPLHLTKKAEQVSEGSNLLKFTLQVNPGSEELHQEGQKAQSYLIVTDISKNMVIQTDSITVSCGGTELTKDETNYKKEDLKDLNWPDNRWGMLSPQEEGQFSLIVPNKKALTITYNARIPKLGDNVPVSNSALIEDIARSNTSYEGSLLVDHIEANGEGSTYKLKIKKINSMDDSKKLKGAEFELYIVRKEDSSLSHTEYVTVGDNTYDCHKGWDFTTGEDGTYEITGEKLQPGNYYILKETKAPDGYEKLDPIIFYYDLNDEKMDTTKYPGVKFVMVGGDPLTVADPPVPYELPETGGLGTAYLYLMGSAFVLMGGAFLLYDRRLAHRRAGR